MISAKEKLKMIDNELAYMKKWYPQRIEDGKMGKDFAEYKISVFQAIKADYVEVVRNEAVSESTES
jgi:hypothetical protein